MICTATIKATGETITVYKLKSGNYFDHTNMAANEPPSCPGANKKEFTPSELTNIKTIKP